MNTPERLQLVSLSVKQPWAWLLCNRIAGLPLKDVENRGWPLPPKFAGARVLIHAGQQSDDKAGWRQAWDMLVKARGDDVAQEAWAAIHALCAETALGGVVGEVTTVRDVVESGSPWFVGSHGFETQDGLSYPRIVPCRGQLGFFQVSQEVARECLRQRGLALAERTR